MLRRLNLIILLTVLSGCDNGDSSRTSSEDLNAVAIADKEGNVTMSTTDDRKVFGFYKKSSASQNYVVLLLHQENSNLHEYDPIIDSLHTAGFDTFQVDLRIGGEKYGLPNRTLELNSEKTIAAVKLDVMAALEYLQSQSLEKIFVTGSGQTGALAISIAQSTQGIATFSPDNDLENTDLKKVAANILRPFFMTQAPTENGIENLFESVPEALNFVRYFPKRGVRGAESLHEDLNPFGFQAMRENYLRFLVKSASGEIKPAADKSPKSND